MGSENKSTDFHWTQTAATNELPRRPNLRSRIDSADRKGLTLREEWRGQSGSNIGQVLTVRLAFAHLRRDAEKRFAGVCPDRRLENRRCLSLRRAADGCHAPAHLRSPASQVVAMLCSEQRSHHKPIRG